MKNKCAAFFLCLILLAGFFAPSLAESSKKYSNSFFGTFDTVMTITAYAEGPTVFSQAFEKIQARFLELHQLYDKYYAYDGVNNVYTLNKMAAKEPVTVSEDLMSMLLFTKETQILYPGTLNIAMGSVLNIWHDYRENALGDPATAALPPLSLLQQANEHTDINKVILDVENSTVFFEDPAIQLDVGAVAKGYAAQLVAEEIPSYGLSSFILSAGGNVVIGDGPKDGRTTWAVGIQDPSGFVLDPQATIDSVLVNHMSVVTSGDYQRYFEVDGKKYHHIIDPATLFPAEYVKQVTVVTPHSGMADFLSTVLYVLPLKQALALAEGLENTEACWVTMDDEIVTTTGWLAISRTGQEKP